MNKGLSTRYSLPAAAICTLLLSCTLLFLGSCNKDDNGSGIGCNCNTQPWSYNDNAVKLYFPTAFTPDGDGRNDQFRLITPSTAGLSSYRLNVYRNDGQLVFTTTHTYEGWNGADAGGNPFPAGSYFFTIDFTTLGGNQLETCGCVHLFISDSATGCIYTNGIAYYFEDQFDPTTGDTPYSTGETICN